MHQQKLFMIMGFKVHVTILYIFFIIGGYLLVGAINTIMDGWNIGNNLNSIVDAHGVCRNVTNVSCNYPIFVPTKTSEEWSQFRANHPVCVQLEQCIYDCTITSELHQATSVKPDDGTHHIYTNLNNNYVNVVGDFSKTTQIDCTDYIGYTGNSFAFLGQEQCGYWFMELLLNNANLCTDADNNTQTDCSMGQFIKTSTVYGEKGFVYEEIAYEASAGGTQTRQFYEYTCQ